jgi:hypothetical protein
MSISPWRESNARECGDARAPLGVGHHRIKSFAACGRNAKSPNASHWDPITKMRRSPNYRFPLISTIIGFLQRQHVKKIVEFLGSIWIGLSYRFIHSQRRPPPASARLQPRQFPAHARSATAARFYFGIN